MTKYAWATDCHLDFLKNDNKRLIAFAEGLIQQQPTGIFLTGDISVASQLVYHLSAIERVVQRPIYFVLGNHDCYRRSIAGTRRQIGYVVGEGLVYLNQGSSGGNVPRG